MSKWTPTRPQDPTDTTQDCTTKHGSANIWRNNPKEWFFSVAGVAESEETAKEISEALMAVLGLLKGGPIFQHRTPTPEEIEDARKSLSRVETPYVPLQVSKVVFSADGTAEVQGNMTLEHPISFVQTNLTTQSEHGSLVFEDAPAEFERILPEEKKP